MEEDNSSPPPPPAPEFSFSPQTPTPTHNILHTTTTTAAASTSVTATTNAITLPSSSTIIPTTTTIPTTAIPTANPLQSHPPFQTKPRKKRTKLLRIETTVDQHGATTSTSGAVAFTPPPGTTQPKAHKSGSTSKKPDPSAPKITRPCTECGKTFWSWKALFGHMRCHPERQWRGINPPPQFRRNDQYPSSSTPNVNFGGEASSSHVAPHATSSATVMTADDYEVSSCLLLLAASGGISTSNVGDHSSGDHHHHQESAKPSVAGPSNMAMVPFQPPREMDHMGEAAAGTSSIYMQQTAGTSSSNAATHDAYYHVGHDPSGTAATNTSGCTKFECSSCKKTFGSHQALGGHRASHKNVKGCFAITRSAEPADQEMGYDHRAGIAGPSGSVAAGHCQEYGGGNVGGECGEVGVAFGSDMGLSLGLGFSVSGGVGGHRCGICMRVFSSGQALGGHKRCHWEKSSEDGGGNGGGGSGAAVELGHGIGSSSSAGARDLTPGTGGGSGGLDLNFMPAAPSTAGADHGTMLAATPTATAASSSPSDADLQLDLRLGR